MVMARNAYRPDHAVPPGWVLEERLAAGGLSQAAFALRRGRLPEWIDGTIAGKAPIEPKAAVRFERVPGVSVSVWLGMESAYQRHMARLGEAVDSAAPVARN